MNNDKTAGVRIMRDARYLRAQAELCLKIARQMSDETTADNLRAEAARHHAEATEIESVDQPPATKTARGQR
jgi:hypothetical protein